jgi:hypothetical protein
VCSSIQKLSHGGLGPVKAFIDRTANNHLAQFARTRGTQAGDPVSGSILLVEWVLMGERLPDVRQVAFAVGSESGEVLPCLGKAEVSVGAASDQVGVMIVLAVVLPEADGTDLEVASFVQRQVATSAFSDGSSSFVGTV